MAEVIVVRGRQVWPPVGGDDPYLREAPSTSYELHTWWTQETDGSWQMRFLPGEAIAKINPNGRDGEWYAVVSMPHEAVTYDGLVVPLFEGDVERIVWERERAERWRQDHRWRRKLRLTLHASVHGRFGLRRIW